MNDKRQLYGTHSPNSYSGKIYVSDFNTEYCNGNTAARIMSDLYFDEQCHKNIEARERRLLYEETQAENESSLNCTFFP